MTRSVQGMMVNVGNQHGYVVKANEVEFKGDMGKNIELTSKIKREKVDEQLLEEKMIDDVRNIIDVTK